MRPRRVKISPPDPNAEAATVDDHLEQRLAQVRSEADHHVWTRRLLLIACSALVATYVLTAIALDLLVDSDRVRSWVEPRASSALNRVVTVGEARIDLVPRPSLRLADVTVDNPPGFGGPALVHLDEVRLDIAWLPLVVGRAMVQRVHLSAPAVHLAIAADGSSNFGDLVPSRARRTPDSEPAPFGAALRSITMSDGSLSLFDAARDRSFMVTHGDGTADLSATAEGAWRAGVVIHSDSLHVRVPSLGEGILRVAGPTVALWVAGDAPLHSIGMDDGYITLGSDTLLVRGRIEGLDEANPSFDVQLTNERLSAGAFVAAFPLNARSSLLPVVEGTVSLTVQVQGGLAAAYRPVMHGTAGLDDVTLRLRGEVVAEHIDGVVQIDSSLIEIQALSGRLAGGPFDLRGTIARDDRLTMALVASSRTDLDALDRLRLLPEGLTLSGSGSVDARLNGPLRAPDSLEAVGTVTLDGTQVEHTRLAAPIYVPAGVVTLDGRSLRWQDLQVMVGTHPLTVTGAIEDLAALRTGQDERTRVHLDVTGGHLDLNLLFPVPPGSPHASHTQLVFAHLAGQTIEGRTARAVVQEKGLTRPARAAAIGSLTLAIDTLSYGDFRLERVETTVTLTDSSVSIPDMRFSTWGGAGHASLALALGSSAEEPFALTLGLDDVDAMPFFAGLTPFGNSVAGRLDADIEIHGLTDGLLLPVGDSLAGRARMEMRDGVLSDTGLNAALSDFLEAGHWSEVPFSSWNTELALENWAVRIEESDLRGALGRVVFGGALSLAGDTDVSVALSLPASQLEAISLRRTGIGPGVVGQLRMSGRPLDLGLHMSGPLGAPSLEPDAGSAVALARRIP
ncbi:MAG: AsmA family protein [Longimicrobiales bacterium]